MSNKQYRKQLADLTRDVNSLCIEGNEVTALDRLQASVVSQAEAQVAIKILDLQIKRLKTKDYTFEEALDRIRHSAGRQRPLARQMAHVRPRLVLRVKSTVEKRQQKGRLPNRNYLTLAEMRFYEKNDPILFELVKKALLDHVIGVVYDNAAVYFTDQKVNFQTVLEAAEQSFERLWKRRGGYGGLNLFTHLSYCTHQVVFGKK